MKTRDKEKTRAKVKATVNDLLTSEKPLASIHHNSTIQLDTNLLWFIVFPLETSQGNPKRNNTVWNHRSAVTRSLSSNCGFNETDCWLIEDLHGLSRWDTKPADGQWYQPNNKGGQNTAVIRAASGSNCARLKFNGDWVLLDAARCYYAVPPKGKKWRWHRCNLRRPPKQFCARLNTFPPFFFILSASFSSSSSVSFSLFHSPSSVLSFLYSHFLHFSFANAHLCISSPPHLFKLPVISNVGG